MGGEGNLEFKALFQDLNHGPLTSIEHDSSDSIREFYRRNQLLLVGFHTPGLVFSLFLFAQ